MNHCRKKLGCVVFFGMLALIIAPAQAQDVPWNVYADDLSASVCDVVNASNVELVVLSDNGPLVIITGPDLILPGTFVDNNGFVFVDGFPTGFIDFALDGDGFRTLWWLTLSGTVIFVDSFTGLPSDSLAFPDEFVAVPCDACELWDDPFDCGGGIFDSDLDGVPDHLDLCPNTPLGVAVNSFGCACFEIDSDNDGVDDCDDECPNTPVNELVNFRGCSCSQRDSDVDGVNDCNDLCPNSPPGAVVASDGCTIDVVIPPPPVVIMCGSLNALTLSLCVAGLCGIRLVSRRRF